MGWKKSTNKNATKLDAPGRTARKLTKKETPKEILDIRDCPGLSMNQKRFLSAYSQTGNLTYAADAAGLCRGIHHKWIKEPVYEEMFELVKEIAIEHMELEARRRAMGGSDLLMMFLLKSFRPQQYRDNHKVEMSGDVTHKTEQAEMTDEEKIQKIHELAERVKQRQQLALTVVDTMDVTGKVKEDE